MAYAKRRQITVDTPKLLPGLDEQTQWEWFAPSEALRHLVLALHNCHVNHTRVKLQYGSYVTGRPWGDKDDWEHGYVRMSTGRKKILLLVHNQRSMGGEALLIRNIVKIDYSNKDRGNVIWVHPLYPFMEWDFQTTYMLVMRFHSIRFKLPHMYRIPQAVPYL